ncbi:putative TAM domain methyltransferase [Colletotrichum tofieldiae]|nr:putative TAM domain methyltransferase [Colletotrichum tofieldiae]
MVQYTEDELNQALEAIANGVNLQHRIWMICLNGELAISPGHKTAKRVLDMGAGTGIWAIDFGT